MRRSTSIFSFTLRGRAPGHAFIDLGDQFLAMSETADRPSGTPERHFGLVVDDRDAVRPLVEAAGGQILPGGSLDFLDPWGNRVEIVDYRAIQFSPPSASPRTRRRRPSSNFATSAWARPILRLVRGRPPSSGGFQLSIDPR